MFDISICVLVSFPISLHNSLPLSSCVLVPMRYIILAESLSLGVAAIGTVEFPLSKRDVNGEQSHVARGVLWRRQETAGTLEESVYNVLPWSQGGGYYTNSEQAHDS